MVPSFLQFLAPVCITILHACCAVRALASTLAYALTGTLGLVSLTLGISIAGIYSGLALAVVGGEARPGRAGPRFYVKPWAGLGRA